MVSFDQAIAEIATVHFDGSIIDAELYLLTNLRDGEIQAFQDLNPIRQRKWRRDNPWSSTWEGVPGISREDAKFFRDHLQYHFENTLWKTDNKKEKNYRGELYRDGVYFTLKKNKDGLNGQAKWNALKKETRDKWDDALTQAIKFAPDYPNNKSALGSKITELYPAINKPERRLGEYFENWNSPE